ncbi:MAG: hypothetical protein ABSA53_06740 [Streptosporangiaceae bacterium]
MIASDLGGGKAGQRLALQVRHGGEHAAGRRLTRLGQGQPEGPAVGRVELPAEVAAVLQPVEHTGQRA